MLSSILLTLALAPSCDVIIPGEKPVANEMVVTGGIEGMRLVATPLAGFGTAEVIPGKPFRFSGKYGTHLYAVPADVALPEDFDRAFYEQQIPASIFPPATPTVPVASPLARILWTYRVLGIEDGELKLELMDEERFGKAGKLDEEGNFVGWLVFIGACGFIGLLLVARRRRSKAAS